MRYKAQHGANTGNNTVQQQTGQPIGRIGLLQQVTQQNRDTGHPNAVFSSVRRTIALFVIGVLIVGNGLFQGSLLGAGVVRFFQRFLILGGVGHACIRRGSGNQLVQSGLCIGVAVILVLCINGICHIFCAVGVNKAGQNIVCVAIGLFSIRSLAGADPKQVPAVAEHAVVGPIRCGGAHGDHGDIIYQEHDHCKDGQAQPTVRHNLIDLIGGGQLAGLLFLVAALDDGGDINITLIGDDALRIVVQFFLGSLNVLFNMSSHLSVQIHLSQHLVVPLKDLDGVPALLLLRQIMYRSLFNMSQRVLYHAGKGVLGNGMAVLCSLYRSLGSLLNAGAFQCGDLYHRAAQLPGQLLGVDFVAVLLDHIHHVDGNHHRDTKFHQLGGQVQVTL